MIRTVLVAFATKHGSTREVAEAVAEGLREAGLEVDVVPVSEVSALERYDAVVLGTALYMGRPHPDARRFLGRRRETLARRPLAVFAMGPKTLGEEDVAGARRQLDLALGKVPELEPVATAIFGGVMRPEELRFPFSRMEASDARDWAAIAAWAREVARGFAAAGSVPPRMERETRVPTMSA